MVNPVNGRDQSASANRHVERAVVSHDKVGDGEPDSPDEFLHFGTVACALRMEMDGVNGGEGPIADEECILIFFGKPGAVSENDSRGRGRANVDDGRHAILVVFGPFGSPAPPAEFSSADEVANAGWAIPGRSQVPFHIGVKGEQVSGAVIGEVECVAKATTDEFALASIGKETHDPARGGVP